MLLSSGVPRDRETAEIIHKKTGAQLTVSDKLYEHTNASHRFRDWTIDEAVEEALEMSPPSGSPDAPVVIVMCRGWIARALDVSVEEIGGGEVREFNFGETGLSPDPLPALPEK